MKKKSLLSASSKSVSSHLETLFASSAGPVEAISLSKARSLQSREEATKTKSAFEDGESGDDEVLSEASQELEYDDDDDEDEDDNGKPSSEEEEEEDAEKRSSVEKDDAEEEAKPYKKERKRKREDDNEQLEEKYLAALARKDSKEEPTGKRVKADEPGKNFEPDNDGDDDDQETIPTHESLSKESEAAEAAKAARTVFVSNVAIEAVSSKTAKKTLLAHLASVLDHDGSADDDEPAQKIESIRFRSVAFSTGSMPKRAAYITKSVMAATTRSTNAYVVFSTAAAARRVCQRLNGTEVLARHIRVDSVAHPSPTDHRRCVFVGNLGFVDDETVLAAGPDGAQEAKKRSKVPADVEEGLWRTFSAHGKVENVRVVRDPKTRVGKGFAYVQFYDANAVEEALLLDGKSFPPMLPRRLRVTRAKDPRKTAQAMERARAKLDRRGSGGTSFKNSRDGGAVATSTYVPKMTPDQQTAAGRAGKLFGRARGSKGAAGARLPAGVKDPQRIVFEGRRASARDSLPKDLKPKNRTKGAKRKRPVMASTRGGGGGDGDWKKKKKSDE